MAQDRALPQDFLVLGVLLMVALVASAAVEYSLPVATATSQGHGPERPVPPFEQWPIVQQPVTTENGQTAEGASTDILVELDDPNSVGMIATLTWTDDIGSNDELSLSIAFEGGAASTQSSTSGNVALNASGDSLTPMAGNWTCTVSVVRAPGLISILPIDRDNGNAWSLQIDALVRQPPVAG